MIVKIILSIFVIAISKADDSSTDIICDYYEGYAVTEEKNAFYKENGVEENCTFTIKECDSTEGRRLDGSCNNLNRECRGTYFVPMPRMLPASFSDGYHSRKALDGSDLELPRVVRVNVKDDATTEHPALTSAVVNYAAIKFLDIGSTHDITNFLVTRPYSCDPAYKDDYWSTPIHIKPYDKYLQNITCLNMTRPMFYQNFKCTKDAVPAPVTEATPAYDFSNIYNYYNTDADKIRAYSGGLLITETENGREWPPNGPKGDCLGNKENETRCFGYHLNGLVGANVMTVLFYLNHNYYANKLAEQNPCWSDEKLYLTARDINIAMSMRIYLYEFWSTLIGRESLVDAGILSESEGCRDIYDDTLFPSIDVEFSYVNRFFHLYQPGHVYFYKNGTAFYNESNTNLFIRTGYLPLGENMKHLVASNYLQPASNDNTVDSEVSENGAGDILEALDITSNDLFKGRLLGLSPYVDYLYHCFGVHVTTFAQLRQFMPIEKIMILKKLYRHPRDIDFWSGVSSERHVKGGYVPVTMACIVKKFMHRAIRSDRFHYELCDGPLTSDQLTEINKSTLSMFFCNVGDATEIQRNAFRIASKDNEVVPCSEIPNINFTAWADSSCASS